MLLPIVPYLRLKEACESATSSSLFPPLGFRVLSLLVLVVFVSLKVGGRCDWLDSTLSLLDMEVAVIGVSQANATAQASEAFPAGRSGKNQVKLGGMRGRRARGVCFPRKKSLGCGAGLEVGRRSRRVSVVRAEANVTVLEKRATRGFRSPVVRRPEMFVGLPLDSVSADCSTVNHAKAIAAGLRAVKLLGADGVELPFWWGIVEKEAMGKYDWSGYLALVRMIQDAGLKVRASLYFHGSKAPANPLPTWVSSIGDADPDIYFTNKERRRYKECLSLAVDELPVLGGKSPVQVYEDFCRSFQATFSEFIGSTITDISIGLGPGGELRYPSSPPRVKNQEATGVGEFQCYDKHMLRNLEEVADASRNHLWGLTGPHDAPRYEQTPEAGNFFKDHGGSWETPYGNFFLTWYSTQLLSHGHRLLSMASKVFGAFPVTVSAKIPLAHTWYDARSHPSELTAGYYNTQTRDGYDAVAEMFARNSCRMIVTGLELSNGGQSRSNPESLVSQIRRACKKHGVGVCGENSSIADAALAFTRIKDNMLSKRRSSLESFTYQRMGASFFSPEHWPRFTEFVRSLNQPELHADDLPSDDEGTISSLHTDAISSDTNSSRQMQAA